MGLIIPSENTPPTENQQLCLQAWIRSVDNSKHATMINKRQHKVHRNPHHNHSLRPTDSNTSMTTFMFAAYHSHRVTLWATI